MAWRGLAAAGLALALGACASGSPMMPFTGSKSPSPSDLILGVWSCRGTEAGLVKSRTVTYAPGGEATFSFSITGSRDGVTHDFAGTGRQQWNILENSRLEEKIVNFSVARARMDGRDVVSGLMQGMVEEMLAQRSAPELQFVDQKMALNYTGGSATDCSRVPGGVARAF